MRRIYLYLTFVILAFLLNNLANKFMFSFRDKIYSNNYNFAWIAELPNKPQIVFIGSSTTKSGLDASTIQKELGLKDGAVVALATTPNNPDIAKHMLQENIDALSPESVILYGLDPWILYTSYYHNFSILMSQWNLKERLAYIRRNKFSREKCLRAINGGSLMTNVTQLFIKKADDMDQQNYGTRVLNELEEIKAVSFNEFFDLQNYDLSEKFLDDLNWIDNLVWTKKMKLIVYLPTYSDSFVSQYKSLNVHDSITLRLQESIRHGILIYEMTSSPDSLFIDMTHFNSSGMQKNNARMQKLLQMKESGKMLN